MSSLQLSRQPEQEALCGALQCGTCSWGRPFCDNYACRQESASEIDSWRDSSRDKCCQSATPLCKSIGLRRLFTLTCNLHSPFLLFSFLFAMEWHEKLCSAQPITKSQRKMLICLSGSLSALKALLYLSLNIQQTKWKTGEKSFCLFIWYMQRDKNSSLTLAQHQDYQFSASSCSSQFQCVFAQYFE